MTEQPNILAIIDAYAGELAAGVSTSREDEAPNAFAALRYAEKLHEPSGFAGKVTCKECKTRYPCNTTRYLEHGLTSGRKEG